MKYVILQYLTGERAILTAKSLAVHWEDIENTWDYIGECDTLPPWLALMLRVQIRLLSVVHGRVFIEKASAYVKDDIAYMEKSIWLEKTT